MGPAGCKTSQALTHEPLPERSLTDVSKYPDNSVVFQCSTAVLESFSNCM